MTTTTNKKELLRRHANRNITYLLDRLGVVFNDRGDGLIQSACPCLQHGGDGDNDVAWSWRRDIGRWVCWSHHCEEDRGNDIFGLVSSIKGVSFMDAMKWIEDTLENKNIDLSEPVPESEQYKKDSTVPHVHESISEDNLKFLTPDPQYLLNRGFDKDVLRKYQVGLWSRIGTYMHDRVVFPVRDEKGFLVGYTGRTVHSEEYFTKRSQKYKKWLHGRHYNRWSKEDRLFTGSILFNLYNAKRYLNKTKKIILVEGPLDGMKLEEAGIKNWVATLGTNFCYTHRTLLVACGVNDIYVAYDADDATQYKDNKSPGEKGWKRVQKVVGDLMNLHFVSLPNGCDCGDLQTEQLQQIFKDISC